MYSLIREGGRGGGLTGSIHPCLLQREWLGCGKELGQQEGSGTDLE